MELLAHLFLNPPAGLQFLWPFIMATCREIDARIRSKLIDKIMGDQDEPAAALNDISVNTTYSLFIAIRLVDAEVATVYCLVILEFVLHLRTT